MVARKRVKITSDYERNYERFLRVIRYKLLIINVNSTRKQSKNYERLRVKNYERQYVRC